MYLLSSNNPIGACALPIVAHCWSCFSIPDTHSHVLILLFNFVCFQLVRLFVRLLRAFIVDRSRRAVGFIAWFGWFRCCGMKKNNKNKSWMNICYKFKKFYILRSMNCKKCNWEFDLQIYVYSIYVNSSAVPLWRVELESKSKISYNIWMLILMYARVCVCVRDRAVLYACSINK